MKRIFVAIPVYQFPHPECMEGVMNLIGVYRERYDFKVRLISGYSADVARNKAINEFLGSECEYLLFLDSDIILNESAFDLMMDADKGAISGIYHKKTHLVRETEVYKVEDGKFKAYSTGEPPEGVFEITACGFGCVLLKREVVKQIYRQTGGYPFRFIQGAQYVSEDIYFCNELSKAKIALYADGRAIVGHVGKTLY